MTTLTEFLLARIAEDEAAALGARTERWEIREDRSRSADVWTELDSSEPHVAVGHDRVLAECEAKRKMVEKYLNWCEPEKIGPNAGLGKPRGDEWARATRFETEMILIIVANIYAAHPDFRPEWRL